MFSDLDTHTKQILTGNLMLIICCIFYIAWWLIAFHPTHAIKGMKSGWLLIPAFIFGVWGVVQIANGASTDEEISVILPTAGIVIGAIIAYIVLFAGTMYFMHRQVTTELFLIVGWTALMLLELDMLYGVGEFRQNTAILLMVITFLAAVVSLVCYLLYYNLDAVKGYIDGIIPLGLAGIMMTVISAGVLIR